jgi:hypothetical protein
MTIDTGASVTIAIQDVASGWPERTPSRRYVLLSASVEEGSLSETEVGTKHETRLDGCHRNLGRGFFFLGWSRTESTITETTKWPIVPAAVEDGWWWCVWSSPVDWLARETEALGENPMSLFPPQIPHDLTRAFAVGRRRLTAWATARPSDEFILEHDILHVCVAAFHLGLHLMWLGDRGPCSTGGTRQFWMLPVETSHSRKGPSSTLNQSRCWPHLMLRHRSPKRPPRLQDVISAARSNLSHK